MTQSRSSEDTQTPG